MSNRNDFHLNNFWQINERVIETPNQKYLINHEGDDEVQVDDEAEVDEGDEGDEGDDDNLEQINEYVNMHHFL